MCIITYLTLDVFQDLINSNQYLILSYSNKLFLTSFNMRTYAHVKKCGVHPVPFRGGRGGKRRQCTGVLVLELTLQL